MKKENYLYLYILSSLLALSGMFFMGSCGKSGGSPATGLHITSFAPASGVLNTTVVINGSNFSPSISGNTVTINGRNAPVTAASATRLSVSVAPGTGDGVIAVQVGGETAHSATDFKYIYTVSTLAGDGVPDFLEGTGTGARFNHPYGMAIDGNGNVYVGDGINQRIRMVTPAGVVTTLAGNGTRGAVNGAGVDAQFNYPFGLVVGASGTILVADGNNNEIRSITLEGVVSTFAGDTISDFKDATGTAARFNGPGGIAIDAAGNVYVADATNERIRKITPAGVVSTLAGNGAIGYKNATGTAAEFHSPEGIAVDGSGNVYVGDEDNNVIRKISPAGVVTTFAGSGQGGYRDGTGTNAQFKQPAALTLDAAGNLYVTDFANHRIRRVTPTGVVTTLAGTGSATFADGPGDVASFKYPSGIAVGTDGAIFVADQYNNRIRKLQ